MEGKKVKSVPVTFRVTAQEYENLKQMAKENGQSVSQYVALHVINNEGVTIDRVRKIYHQLLKIKDYVQREPQSQFAEEIGAECDIIWQCLK